MSGFDVFIQQLINGLMLGIMYSLVAVGFTLYFGVLNVINFAHGDFFMLGGFMALIVYAGLNAIGVSISPLLMLALILIGSMVLTAGVGVITERIAIKPVSKAPMLISLLVTLGLGIALREAVRVFYPRGSDPQLFPTLLPQESFNIGNVVIRYENVIIFALGLAIIVIVNFIINRTKMGMAIRAVAQDGDAAMMMGVNLNRTVDITFIIGSTVAAVAGIMNGLYYGSVMFNIGAVMGVIGFSAAVIGGLGNVYGAIVGGLLFALLETAAAAFIPNGAEWRRVVAFAVVILFLIFKPTGILGERSSERV